MGKNTKFDTKRSQRSVNFTSKEEETLLRLALKRMSIIECKISNQVSTNAKNEVWNEIAEKFNSVCPGVVRTATVLRNKYTNIKRQLRRDQAAERLTSKIWKPKSEVMAKLAEAITTTQEHLTLFDDDDDDDDDMLDNQSNTGSDPSSQVRSMTKMEMDETVLDEVKIEPEEVMAYDLAQIEEFNCNHTETLASDTSALRCSFMIGKNPIIESAPKKQNVYPKWRKINPTMLRKIKAKRNANGGETVLEMKKKLLQNQIIHERTEHKFRLQQIASQVELGNLRIKSQRKDDEMRQAEHEMRRTEHEMKMKILAAEYERKLNSTTDSTSIFTNK